jgi:signal transduction histidine kinase
MRYLAGSLVGFRVVAAGLTVLSVALPSFAADASDTVQPGVLILHSNQRPTALSVVVENELRESVPKGAGSPVQLYSEYLDTEWLSLQTHGASEAEFLRDKYGGRNIRVVAAVASLAFQFATEFHDRISPGLPVVLISAATDRVDPASLPDYAVGVFDDYDPTPTLQLALRLHPDARRLVAIRGASELDPKWDQRVRDAVGRLGTSLEVEYLAGLPTASVLQRVAALPRGTIVYTPGYFVDGAGNLTTPPESTKPIARASTVPVYGAYDSQLGSGIVGGYMFRFEDEAREGSAKVVRLLSGATPAEVRSSMVSRAPMVDWRQLRRWHIDETLLPPDSIVMFREPTAWDRYAVQISVGVALLVLQTALIAGLLFQRARRRRADEASSMLAGRLLTAHEDERSRLARDLHDDVSQRLARLAIDAGRLERRTDAAPPAVAGALREELVRLSEDVHALSYQLHPAVLDELGLSEGIKAECSRLSRQQSIPVNVEIEGLPRKLPTEPSLCLFRVAQEALRNVVRHARARAVTVSLSSEGRGVRLVVKDNGRGFDTSRDDTPPSLGQVSMRERVRLLGGTLRVESSLGEGTTVSAWVPLEEAAS